VVVVGNDLGVGHCRQPNRTLNRLQILRTPVCPHEWQFARKLHNVRDETFRTDCALVRMAFLLVSMDEDRVSPSEDESLPA